MAVNTHYLTNGRWNFSMHRLLAEGNDVVTEVTVSDAEQTGRAITFSTVQDGRIVQQTEYWPDPFEPAAWRAH